MKHTNIFTATGNDYWHFHPIGVGVILTYHLKAMQIMTTCEHTGCLIDVEDYYQIGGLSKDIFKQICLEFYATTINCGYTVSLDYIEPTIVGCVGVDFNLIKN